MTAANLVPLIWAAGAAAIIAWAAWTIRRKRQTVIRDRVRAEWGRLTYRDADHAALVAYHRAVAGSDASIDERTWDDLNMGSVFTVIDRTESTAGQQALYHRLRTPQVGPVLDAFDTLVKLMDLLPLERERAQVALASVRGRGACDMWRLTTPGALDGVSRQAVFLALAAIAAVSLAATFVWPAAIFGAGAAVFAGGVVRSMRSREFTSVIEPFRAVGSLLAAATTIAEIQMPGTQRLTGTLRADLARLDTVRRVAGWVRRDGAPGFDLGSALFEFLNAVFHFDACAWALAAGTMKARAAELGRVIAAVGEIDAAISVASYRRSAGDWTRPVWRAAGGVAVMAGIRHPLLEDAVPNSVIIGDPAGVIVTGSNMSGKSTFLRTVGVTAVLAQTINTCLAASYEAPPFVVKSCIGRADDPATGKSYYLVEVDSVLALVRDSASDAPHLFLFDELFRGTNAVERIAAGEAVLRGLLAARPDGKPSPHVVVAATHDQELVDLVTGWYVAYHFSDAIGGEGLAFDYQLQPGVTTSRNAITLLKLRGAPEALVERALSRAAALDRMREPALLAMGARTSS